MPSSAHPTLPPSRARAPPPSSLLGSDQIFEGKKPFCGISSKEVKALIIEGKTLDTPVLLKEQGLEDVYRSCLEVDWTKRPKMGEVVEVLSY